MERVTIIRTSGLSGHVDSGEIFKNIDKKRIVYFPSILKSSFVSSYNFNSNISKSKRLYLRKILKNATDGAMLTVRMSDFREHPVHRWIHIARRTPFLCSRRYFKVAMSRHTESRDNIAPLPSLRLPRLRPLLLFPGMPTRALTCPFFPPHLSSFLPRVLATASRSRTAAGHQYHARVYHR